MSAIISAAVVTAGATIYASNKSSSATQDATNASINQQNQALTEQAQLSQPYRDLGAAAIPAYEQLLGITPPAAPATATPATGATPPMGGSPTIGSVLTGLGGAFRPGPGGIIVPQIPGGSVPGATRATPATGATPPAAAVPNIEQALQATPGYQFARDQGEKGILNAASLQGGISGNTLASLDQFNTGLADETYQQQLDNLARAVGTGQSAAAGQAQNVGTSAANIGNALINQGQTNAGIAANEAAGLTKTIGSAVDQYQTNQALNALKTQTPAQSWSDPSGSGYTYTLPGP